MLGVIQPQLALARSNQHLRMVWGVTFESSHATVQIGILAVGMYT
jgi:hypothetical protein